MSKVDNMEYITYLMKYPFSEQLIKPLYLAIRHQDSEKIAALLTAGADQDAHVEGTDVTPRLESIRRKHYPTVRQLVAYKMATTQPSEEPDLWDLPYIEDMQCLFQVY